MAPPQQRRRAAARRLALLVQHVEAASDAEKYAILGFKGLSTDYENNDFEGPWATPLVRKAFTEEVEACIIGAGFSGIGAAKILKDNGVSAIRIFEKGSDLGGTWYWNRYPEVACDFPSASYCFSFGREDWYWSRKYGRGPEIYRYCQHIAEKFDIYKHCAFQTAVVNCDWDEAAKKWIVKSNRGDEVVARHLVFANGPLSSPKDPDIEGMETFQGKSLHTARFDQTYDLSGKVIGVIGTGASAVQTIPEVSKVAKELYVFQRTPCYCFPRDDSASDPEYMRRWQSEPGFFESRRQVDFDRGEKLYHIQHPDYKLNEKASERASNSQRDKIRRIVTDPKTAEALCPKYPLGCKRPPVHDDYWPTFNKPNVHLIHDERGVTKIGPKGPIMPDGTAYELDVIIYATGFDALVGQFGGVAIKGRDKTMTMQEQWQTHGVRTLYGTHSHGYPNMYIMLGPQQPSVLGANALIQVEYQSAWIAGMVKYMKENGYNACDPSQEEQEAWVAHCDKISENDVHSFCDSWYNGRNGAIKLEKGKTLPYVGSWGMYTEPMQKKGFSVFSFDK